MSPVSSVLLAATLTLTGAAQLPGQVMKPRTEPSLTERLPAPSEIKASQQPDGSIRVVWRAVVGAKTYSVTRSVPPTPAAKVSAPDFADTVYIDRDVKVGSSHYYLVGAINEAGLLGLRASATPVVATTPATTDTAKTTTTSTAPLLPAPAAVSAALQPDGSIRVVWRAVAGATGYALSRTVSPASSAPVLPNPADTVYVDRDVKAGSTYTYQVAAINSAGAGGAKVSSSSVQVPAATASDTTTSRADTATVTALAAPTEVRAEPSPYMEPTITWKSSETRARFLVERRAPNVSATEWKKIWEMTVANGHWKCCVAHDRETIASQNLEYRVTAVDTVVPSSKSPPAVSNVIVNWPIHTDPPVLSELRMKNGESQRLLYPRNRPIDLQNLQWVSLNPEIASVDLQYGIVKAVQPGTTHIVATGIARRNVPYVGNWIWRLNVEAAQP